MEPALENYLVLHTGYEGIEHVYGVFTLQEALDFHAAESIRAKQRLERDKEYEALMDRLNEKYKKAFGNPKDYCKVLDAIYLDPEYLAYDRSDELGARRPEEICIVTVTPKGTKCVCKTLGISAPLPLKDPQ